MRLSCTSGARRAGFVCASLAAVCLIAGPSSAATFEIYLDLDNSPATGCPAVGAFGGFEQRLNTVVTESSSQVTAVSFDTCASGVFANNTAVSPILPPWPIGVGSGVNGTNVIETYLASAQLAIPDPPVVRILAVGGDGGQLVDTAGPATLVLASVVEIPTLGRLELMLLAALLFGAALLVLRRGGAPVLAILLLLGGATAAWAAVTLDGSPADWAPTDQVATDPVDGPPGADIEALFAKEDVCNGTTPCLAFRIDAQLVFNQPPVAVDDAATVSEDPPGAVQIDVLANDSDPEADPFTIGSVTQPANGTVAITNGGADLSYLPDTNYCNNPPGTTLDTFTYSLTPGGDTATVTVTVTCVDDNPTAVDDAATVAEDSGANPIDVLANDTDPDGGAMLVTAVQNPSGNGGTVLITNGGADLSYQPAAGYCNNPPGTTLDTFTYTITGGSVATVTVTVNCVDDLPTAVDDGATVAEDSGANPVDVLANDTDPDGGPMTVNAVQNPSAQGGTVLITNGGADVSYAPAPNYCNTPPGTTLDTFTYTLNGGSTATVTVTVNCVDDPPLAVADSATVDEDSGANAIDVLANDTDIDGGPMTVNVVGTPSTFGGTVVITNGGLDLTYAPAANYCNNPPGTTLDTFTYTLNGGASATVTVTVNCLNDGPAIDLDADDDKGTGGADFAVTFNEGDPATLLEDPADATVTDIDSATLQSITITLTNILDTGFEVLDADLTGFPGITKNYDTTTPPTGILTLTGPDTLANFQAVLRTVTYLNSDTDVDDSAARVVQFVANDGTANGNTATSTVTVVPVDTPPTAVNDSATVNEDSGANAIDVLANDTDPDGGPISITSVTQPTNGTVVITNGGADLTYAPNANYCNAPPGTTLDTFTYTLTPGGSIATVTVTVTCVDDNPTAVNDAVSVAEDDPATTVNVQANDTDADGGTNTITAVQNPSAFGGTVLITNAGADLTYQPAANYCNTPPGATLDTFTYTLTPGGSVATVTVTVTCVDDNPTAVNDSATVNEDSGANTINVLANDTDIDGGPKSVTSVTQPANGAVVITNGGADLTYAPNANYCNNPPGTFDTFTYTLTPGGSVATVSVTVTCVDDPPTAVNDSATVNEDSGANTIDVQANDTDPDGGTNTIQSVTQPTNGAVVITNGGADLTYAPNLNYCNNPPGTTPDTFTYTLTPGGSVATVSVSVICINDAPALTDATPNYTAIGNTQLRAGATPPVIAAVAFSTDASSVLANGKAGPVTDVDGPGPIEVVVASGASANGGTFSIEADGHFTYHPPTGFTGTDTFAIQVTDNGAPAGVANATVTIAVSELVWYVQNDTATAGNAGTSVDPADTLLEAETPSTPDDFIYVFQGDGTDGGQNAGITLKNGQKLLGEGVDLVVSAITLVTGNPANKPLVSHTTGNAVTVLANTANGDRTNIEIRGLSLSTAAATFNAIDATSANAANLGVTISENAITGAPAEGIDINCGSTGTGIFSIHDNTLQATGTALDLQRTAGTVTVTAFDDNSVSGDSAGAGIVVGGPVAFDGTPGGAYNQVAGGNTAIGAPGNAVGGAGLSLASVTGDLAFTDLDIFAGGGAAFSLTGNGAVNVGAGAGTRVTVGTGVGVFEAAGGPAAAVDNATIDLQLSSLRSTGTTTSGVTLVNADDGTTPAVFSAGSCGSPPCITTAGGASGPVFRVDSSNADVTYAGSINATAGIGISLTNNPGGTTILNGDFDLTTGPNAAFTATGGGAVTVQGTSNTINTTTGIGVNIATPTTIGAAGVTFLSVTVDNGVSNSAVNAIVLNGVTGFTVSGDGSTTGDSLDRDGSGGTIDRTTGHSVLLTNASNVTLRQMNVTNTPLNFDGVNSTGGSNVVLSAMNFDTLGRHGWSVTDLGGVNRVDNNSRFFTWNAAQSNAVGVNQNVNWTSFTIERSLFSTSVTGADAFLFDGNAGGGSVTVTNSEFTLIDQDALQVNNDGDGTITAIVQGNNFHDADNASGDGNNTLFMANSGNGILNFTIGGAGGLANSFTNLGRLGCACGVVQVNAVTTSKNGTRIVGTVQNNTISNTTGRRGIDFGIEANGGSHGGHSITVTGNTISNTQNQGINLLWNSVNGGDVTGNDFTITNNVLTSVGLAGNVDSGSGIEIENNSANAGGNFSADALIEGNTVTNNNTSAVGSTLDLTARSLFAGDTTTVNFTVRGNTLTNSSGAGEVFEALGSGSGGTLNLCVDVNGLNTSANTFGNGGSVRLTNNFGTYNVGGMAAGAQSAANVQTHVTARNTFVGGSSVTAGGAVGTFAGSPVGCTLP